MDSKHHRDAEGVATSEKSAKQIGRDALARPLKMQKPHRLRASPGRQPLGAYPRLVENGEDLTGDDSAAQRALRESEDRFRNLVDGSLAGTLVTRGSDTLYASRRLAEIFGYTIAEFSDLKSIYAIVAPHDRARLQKYEAARLAGKPAPDRYEFEGVRKDRTPVWVEISVGIVPWELAPAIQATIIDISERKQVEQALKETAEQYRALIEGSMEGTIIRHGEKPVLANQAFADTFGYSIEEILALDDIDALRAPHERRRLRRYQKDRLRGRAAPSRYEFEGVRKDGSQIWLETSVRVIAWRGKPATQSTVVDISERKRAERQLQESERKFRNLVEGAIEGILIRRDNKLVFVNQPLADMFGYSTDELLALKSIDALFAPSERARLRGYYEQRSQGNEAPSRYEFEGQRKDGTVIWLDASVREVEWEGRSAIQATLVDRTQHKREEQKRLETEARFRNLIEGSIQAVAIIDKKQQPRFVNPAAARIFGFDSVEEMLAVDSLEPYIAAADRKRLSRYLERRLAGEPLTERYEFRCVRKDGKEVWLENLARAVDWDGEPCVQATLVDITDRKLAELAVEEARASLQRIIDTIPALVSVKDSNRRYTLVNQSLRDAFGTDMIGKRAKLMPRAMRLIKQEDEQVLASGEVLPFHEAELDFRGGKRTWLQTKVPLKSDDGEVEHILSVSFDITDRKRVEEELRESESRYRSLIEQASDAVVIHVDGQIVLANPLAANLLAVRRASELIGESMFAYVEPASHGVARERVRQVLKDQAGIPPVEQTWLRQDGTRVDVEVSGSYARWQGRAAVTVIARDITERKKTDTALRMLQYAVDNAVDAVYWMRPDGSFNYVNDAACRMLGYTRDQFAKLKVWDINPGLTRNGWQKRLAEIKAGSHVSEAKEFTHRASDGELIPVETTTSFVRFNDQEFAFGFARDARERKQTEAALERTQFAVDTASDAVYLLRPDGSFVYANETASKMLGYSRAQLESTSVFDINPDHTPATFKKAFAKYKRSRNPSPIEQRHQTSDGRIVPVEVAASYFKFGENEGLFAFVRDIGERHAAEALLRQSEERYRSLVELSPDPVMINCEGKVAFVNVAGLSTLGLRGERDIVGKDALTFVHPESRALVTRRVGRSLKTKAGGPPAEIKWVRPDGTIVELESSTSFVTWEGKPAVQVVVRDITERKRTEQALRITQFAIDQASDAVYLVKRDGGFEYANATASEMLGYSQEELRSMSVYDINPDISRTSWRKRFARIIEGTSGTLFVGQTHRAKGGRLIPVEISGNYYRFGDEEGMLAFVRDVSARVQSESALRDSEARYRSVVEQSPDAIFINCDGKLVFVNSAGARLFGAVSAAELIGRDAMSTIHPQTRDLARRRIAEVIRKKATVAPTEQRWLGIDGSVLDVESTASYVTWDGKPALQVVARDIGKRKQAERILKLTQFAVDRGFDAVVRVVPDGSLVDVNDATCRLLGYTRDELLALTVSDYVVDLSKAAWRNTLEEVKRVGSQTLFRDYRRKDGTTIPVEVSINYVEIDDDEYVIGFARDITERKQYETDLKESEARYRRLFDDAPDAIIITNDLDILFANAAAARMLGYRRPQQLTERKPFEIIEPAYRKDAIRRTRRLLANSGPLPTMEQRLVKRDSGIVEVEVTGSAIRWQGRPAGQFIVRDITERKRTENALRMTQFAIDTASDGVSWLDSKGNMFYANQAMAELFGYSVDELAKMKSSDINPRMTPTAWRALLDRLRKLGVMTDEYTFKRKDGSPIAVEITDNFFKFGDREYIFSFFRDISERKRTESALRLTQFAVHNVSDGILWATSDGKFAYANDAAARLLGYGNPAELIGQDATIVNPNRNADDWPDMFEAVKRSGTATAEVQFARKDGSVIPIEITDNYFVYENREYLFAFFRDITERKRTEDALKLTQFSIDNAAGAVFWAEEDGSLVYTNSAANELLGYGPAEYRQLKISDIDPDMTRQRWHARFAEVRDNPEASTTEITLRAKSGKLIPVEITDNFIKFGDREYIFAFCVDISERKAAEAELRERQQQLDSVTRNIPGSVFQRRISPDGSIDFPYVSPGSSLVWGIDSEAVQSNPDAFMDILHPEDRKEFEAKARESAKTMAPLDMELRAFGPDGEMRWARMRSSPRRLEDGSIIWDGVSLDETERKVAELQVREHETQLAHLMRVTTMGEMATALAHELGQPLNAIANFTRGCVRRLQSDSWDQDEITKVMEQACEQAERAALIVRDIAEFIRGSDPEIIPCDINEIVGSAQNLAAAEANDRGVKITLRLAKSLPLVSVDSIQIEQVLLNLMRNGIEAMTESWSNQGVITVRTAVLESGHVRIDVRDSGPPADPDAIDQMFEAFHSSKVDGMGMGLAISRTIIEAHDGRLWATPNKRRGMTFHFTLPVESQRD